MIDMMFFSLFSPRNLTYRGVLGGVALLGLLLSGGCGIGKRYGGESSSLYPSQSYSTAEDYERNHPVRGIIERQDLIVELTGGERAILSDRQRADISRFVSSYHSSGASHFAVVVPPHGSGSDVGSRLVASVVDTLSASGLARSSYQIIPSGSGSPYAYPHVRLHYSQLRLSGPPRCESWGYERTGGSRTPSLGCVTQQNLAAQISDPKDYIAPETVQSSARSSERLKSVYENYIRGEATASGNNQDVRVDSTTNTF